MTKKYNFEIKIFIFFLIYFFLGTIIYNDYGIGIEEHFQRRNGFYWLNYFLSNTNFDFLKTIADFKYKEILQNNPDLPDPNLFNFYGIIFDFPLALIETLLKLDDSKSYFELRHFSIFLIFFVSSIYFYKILKERFNNNLIIFLGLFLYIFTPRIFGDSFHNNKDILFLSILTISIGYLFKLFKKDNLKNLTLFCFFAALATSSRIMGIYLPIILIIFYFLEYLIQRLTLKNFIYKSLIVIIIFYFFLIIHYPYIWQLNIFEIQNWFKNFFYWMNIEVLFNGQYYPIKYLPRSYLPILILISTPLIIIFFSILGAYYSGNKILKSILSIEENKIKKKGELWNSINEKKDLFIFISFFSFISFAIFLNVAMLSGWRHFYFLHIFIIYFSTLGSNYLYDFLIKKININIIRFSVFIIVIYFLFLNFKFHPYQSLYFNNFLGLNYVSKFQVDTLNLSRLDALKFIIKNNGTKKDKVFVANASWTPMYYGKDMLRKIYKEKLIFVGQEFHKADYIYTNYVYQSDNKYDKRFVIPSNFEKIKDFKIDNIMIYSIYKKRN